MTLNVQPEPVPKPVTLGLLGVGAVSVAILRRLARRPIYPARIPPNPSG